jgi:D-alanine-D-alanine ligase
VRAYKSVDCRDFGRVDFRVDEAGNPYVLEINPLPNLSPDDVFVLFGKVKGDVV